MAMLRFLGGLLALISLQPVASSAETWPSRPVRLIVPVVAGGSTDAAARVIGEYLSRALGQQFIVENRSGAGGLAGIEAVGKSAPDGYTILVTTDRVASAPHVLKLGVNPVTDLSPVIQISRQPVVLAVHPSLGVASLAEFLALARARPGMSYATSGVGIHQHVAGEWLQKLAGIKLTVIPYRGGAQATNDLIAGHVKIASLGSPPLIEHYRAGTVRLLAQSTAARSPKLLDVPTYEEAGIKGLVLDQWNSVFVPAGTPASIVARLNAEINKALAEPANPRGAAAPIAGAGRRQRRSGEPTLSRRFRQIWAPDRGIAHQSRIVLIERSEIRDCSVPDVAALHPGYKQSRGTAMPLSIRNLDAPLGAEVSGVDLAEPLARDEVDAIEQAWRDRLVVVVRGQELSDPQLLAFSRYFGELDPPGPNPYGEVFNKAFPDINVISNVIENDKPIGNLGDGEAAWHADMTYIDTPPKAAALYALEVPEKGGNTYFADMFAAYASLPAELKRAAEGKTAVHDGSRNSAGLLRKGYKEVTDVRQTVGARHPLVRTDAQSGRKALFLGRRPNSYVMGLDVAESEALLDALWAHATQRRFVMCHEWRVGDLLMWNNLSVLHRRDAFDSKSRRVMHRTQIKGNVRVS